VGLSHLRSLCYKIKILYKIPILTATHSYYLASYNSSQNRDLIEYLNLVVYEKYYCYLDNKICHYCMNDYTRLCKKSLILKRGIGIKSEKSRETS